MINKMKLKTFSIFVLMIIVCSSLQTSFASPLDVNVPPTPAYSKISNGTTSSNAPNYKSTLTLSHGSGVTVNIFPLNNTVFLDSAASSSKAQGSNLGSNGVGPYYSNYNATMLQFLRIVSSNSNCAITSNTTNIILTCSGGSGSSTYDTLKNIGLGQGSVYAGNTTSTTFQFKTIKAGNNITVQNNTNDITISGPNLVNGTNGKNGTNGTNGSSGSQGPRGYNGTSAYFNSITCGGNQFLYSYNNATYLASCATPTISINGLSRSLFTGVLANQTIPVAAPKVSINGNNRSSFTSVATTNSSGNSISGHIVTFPQTTTGTILLGNGSISSLTGTLAALLGVTTLSNAGHVSTFPSNTGTLLQANGSGSSLTGIPTLSGTNIWTGTNQWTTTGHLLENPAKTFATTLAGGAQTSNQTITMPVIREGETMAVKPQINFSSSSNKTGATTLVMLGDGVTLTPQVTGRVEISVSGYATSSIAADGGQVQIRQVSGGCPANAAAVTGTALGSDIKMTAPATTTRDPFSITVQSTGLTINQKYCFELSQQSITSGTFTVFNVMWSAKEI